MLALDGVSFEIERGSCHALIGENGAGKSTLGKILAGVYYADEGEILLDGKPIHPTNPLAARKLGIAMVHQELAFCPNLTVAENLCLGDFARARRLARPTPHARPGPRDARRNRSRHRRGRAHRRTFHRAGTNGPDRRRARHPRAGHRHGRADQFALRARERASLRSARPNSSNAASRSFTSRIAWRKFSGCATPSPSCAMAVTSPPKRFPPPTPTASSIKWSGAKCFPHTKSISRELGEEVLRVENLSSPGKFSNVSFTLRAGEVLGFAGLVGAGRSEVAQAIFGLDPKRHGKGFCSRKGTCRSVRCQRRVVRGHRFVAGRPQAPGPGALDELPREHFAGGAWIV